MGFNGGFESNLNLTPRRSQVFTTCWVVLTALSLAAGFFFLWFEKEMWHIPMIAAGICGSVSLCSYAMSHKNVDLSGGKPTEFHVDSESARILCDPRTTPSKDMLKIFAEHVSAVAHRRPLPRSSGLVGHDGALIPNTVDVANEKITELNALALEEKKRIDGLMNASKERPVALSESAPSYTGEMLEGFSVEKV